MSPTSPSAGQWTVDGSSLGPNIAPTNSVEIFERDWAAYVSGNGSYSSWGSAQATRGTFSYMIFVFYY